MREWLAFDTTDFAHLPDVMEHAIAKSNADVVALMTDDAGGEEGDTTSAFTSEPRERRRQQTA